MFTWKQKAYDLMQQRAAQLKAAETAFEANDTEAYTTAKTAVEALNGQIEEAKAMAAETEKDFGVTQPIAEPGEPKKKTKATSFGATIKDFLLGKGMTEGTNTDGGYTVPADIDTQIREYRDATASLIDLVTAQTTSMESGEMTYRSRSTATGFSEVTEMGKGEAATGLKYERISWKVKKYMGMLPVSNELLEDSDADIEGEVVRWAGEESRATENKGILAVLQAKSPTAITGLDDIKTALNVTLGAAFKGVSQIVTNDSGLNYLDTLADNNGRPLLNPDPTDSARLQLRAGATVVPIVVVPDAVLANSGTKIPFIVGSLRDAVLVKIRKGLTIMPTKEGSVGDFNAFEQDCTIFRFIKRLDIKKLDDKAWCYLQLDTAGE